MKKQKKIFVLPAAAWLLFISFFTFNGDLGASTAEEKKLSSQKGKIGLSLRLSGGFGYLFEGVGDLDRAREGMNDIISYIDRWEDYQAAISWDQTTSHPDLKFDVILNLTSHFGIGVRSGYIPVLNSGNYSLNYSDQYSNWNWERYSESNEDTQRNYKFTVIPVSLNLYFYLPIGKSRVVTLFGYGGFGRYFGKMTHTIDTTGISNYERYNDGALYYKSNTEYSLSTIETAKASAWGIDGGLGWELKVTSFVSLGIEIYGRLSSLKNWKGEIEQFYKSKDDSWSYWTGWDEDTYKDSYIEKGDLWVYEISDSETNEDFTQMRIYEEEPESDYIKNVNLASINLNSVGALLSLRFHFSLSKK